MLKFIRTVGAVILGNLIAAGIIGTAMLMGVSAMILFFIGNAAESNRAAMKIPDNSLLVLNLNMVIADTPPTPGASEIISEAIAGRGDTQIGALDLCRSIERAARDQRIGRMLITGTLIDGDYANLQEVRRAIGEFRAAGKEVIAHIEAPSPRDYFLVSASDLIVIHPFGEIGFTGLATNNPYFGEALKRYGIGIQTTKVGAYKSAVEPFTSDKMSANDREQTQALIESLWGSITQEIGTDREVAPEKLREVANTLGIMNAEQAVANGLADSSAYLDEVLDHLEEVCAIDPETGYIAQVDLLDYITLTQKNPTLDSHKDKLVVVYAEGEIVDGDMRNEEQIGGHRLAADIRALRHDETVKAIILRVNSPGGSAFASEVARREVELFRDSGRPIVVSMGGLAASGGYWISAGATEIFAEETTITGSIGVFGLMGNIQKLAEGFGVHFDGVKTSRFADINTIARPKTDAELALLQHTTDEIYDQFLAIVAEGRNLELARVAEIAQGRVWSGKQALSLGLVDKIGGLKEAIAHTRSLAKLPADAPVVQLPEKIEPSEAIAELFSGNGRREPIAKAITPESRLMRMTSKHLRRIESFNDRRQVYARLPYLLELN